MEKTKAETLCWLCEKGFPVPETLFFSCSDWDSMPQALVARVQEKFGGQRLAVRSSARNEDSAESSQAGAYKSVLHVPARSRVRLTEAVDEVRRHLSAPDDQIFFQPMVEDTLMSGVVMTRHLDDGSPYYVVNYDDFSGRTDTITGGNVASKTVYIYKGVQDKYFDSPRLKAVVALARKLEECYDDAPLDIEFALDRTLAPHLLQVRRIAASRHWEHGVEEQVGSRIGYVETFIGHVMAPKYGLYGSRTILGVMPDWNPAEIIGISPRPLALSLYRELITRRTWSLARETMGYHKLPAAELMLSVGGRPYIDVRASFNSFLPGGLSPAISAKLVDAWLDRLDINPRFHDKIEFEVVQTIADPDMEAVFEERYPGLLSKAEFREYADRLQALTRAALGPASSMDYALRDIETLRAIQATHLPGEKEAAPSMDAPDLALRISTSLEQCRQKGTLPFSIIARHAFIAESLLRSTIRAGILTPERVALFKRDIHTVSGELTRDFRAVGSGLLSRESFLLKYAHLRPGTYDILSPAYGERADLFESGTVAEAWHSGEGFHLSSEESSLLAAYLRSGGLPVSGEQLLDYARKAIAGREYAKFIFTRHISHVLDLLVLWGRRLGLSREDMSMLTVNDVLDYLSSPLRVDQSRYFAKRVEYARREYNLMRSFKMAFLLRSVRDVYIVPQHRSAPNFITAGKVQAELTVLDQHGGQDVPLQGRIVCIESADPGYDWIFTRDIAGLLTRYGGTNSHMAIRCAEYGLPAAIGCGQQIFDEAAGAASCLLDCESKTIRFFGSIAADSGLDALPV